MESIKKSSFMISAICSIVLGALFVFAHLAITITTPNLDLKPGSTNYVTAVVSPTGEHDLSISSEICKDTNGDGSCEELLSNPCEEISIVFEDTGNGDVTTAADGKASIKITLGADASLGNVYMYYVETENDGWEDAKVSAQTTSIPEFSTMAIPLFTSLAAFALVFRKRSSGFNF